MKRAIILAACLIALPAMGQQGENGLKGHKITVPPNAPNPLQKIEQVLTSPGQPVKNAPCDFNIFSALEAKNLGSQIAVCAVGDIKAALDSATNYKDTVGISCLTPALAIVQAAAGATQQEETNAPPAPGTAAPQSPAGLILLFQKYREFVLSGGPSACKSWVNTTITGGSLLAQ